MLILFKSFASRWKNYFESRRGSRTSKLHNNYVCYGFSPTITEVREIICDYLESNIKTAAGFKDVRPGKDWFKTYFNRNYLSLIHAEMMCTASKKATDNPFVIYEFHQMIDTIFKRKNLTVK